MSGLKNSGPGADDVVRLDILLQPDHVEGLALYVKRLCWSDVRAVASTDVEAHRMWIALMQLHVVLEREGLMPP